MSRKNSFKVYGWLFAVMFGAVGCGGPIGESPPGDPAEVESPELSEQQDALGSNQGSQCRPAAVVNQSPELDPSFYYPVLVPLRGSVYFVAPPPGGGPTSLWRIDGTSAAPIRADVRAPLMKSGDLLYFTQGGALWATDGTASGTRQLKSLDGGSVGVFKDVRGRLFFAVARTGDTRVQLWVTDGTPGGTRALASFASMARPYPGDQMVDFHGRLFFVADDGKTGRELWKSDGTPGGTRLFKDIAPGPASSEPSQLKLAGNALYYVADDQVHGAEIWTTQSMNPAETYLLRDFAPNGFVSNPTLLGALSNALYFTVHPVDQYSDIELWRTDGSRSGTVRVKRFFSPNPTSTELWSGPSLAAYDLIYFTVYPLSTTGPGVGNVQLWRTNGTANGTIYLTEPLTFGDQGPIPELFPVDGVVLFAARENLPFDDPRQHGRELWKTQGTPASTRLLQDLRPGPDLSNPNAFAAAGAYVYFLADDAPLGGPRIWALHRASLRCSGPLH